MARVKTRSQRKMTWWRSLGYRMVAVLAYVFAEILWRSSRLRFIGEEKLQAAIDTHGAVVFVCWHQHLLLCSRYAVARRIKGLRIGFLISPSLDGEGPSMLAALHRAEVIRGSGTYTGAQAVRALYKQIKTTGLSPLITPDGPRGPRFEFKGGALTIAQLCEIPLVPLAFAAKPVKILGTWDKFVLPMPFSKMVIAVGEPVLLARKSTDSAADAQLAMAQRLYDTYLQARSVLAQPS